MRDKFLHGHACFAVLALVICFSGCRRSNVTVIATEVVKVDSLQQILPLTDTLIKPVLYTNITGLDKIPLKQAKQTFIAAVLPSILVAKHRVSMEKVRLAELEGGEWTSEDSVFVQDLKRRYRAKDVEELYTKIGTMPTSIVLAQAAVESSWGRSRFFVEASNVFGVWSTDSSQSRIPARVRRSSKVIYLRSYQDISSSVHDYFEVLSRSRAYRTLRKARLETNDPFKLLPYLKSYSERRSAYTRLLRRVIEQNNLTRYDRCQIHPDYFRQL